MAEPAQTSSLPPASGLRARVPAEWWRTFFSHDYCTLYRHEFNPRRTREEVAMAVEAVPLEPGDRVLDLGCGHGRHLQFLRRDGYRAVGVDFSRDQLAVARDRARTFDEPLPLARGDVRLLPFRDAAFDAVLAFNGSFAYFGEEGDRRHLAEAARVLRPGGALLLDQQNPEYLMAALPRQRRVRDPDTGEEVIEEFEVVAAERRVYARKEFRAAGGRRELFFTVRAYSLAELAAILAQLGLCVRAALGDYDRSPYGPASARMILVARKEREWRGQRSEVRM